MSAFQINSTSTALPQYATLRNPDLETLPPPEYTDGNEEIIGNGQDIGDPNNNFEETGSNYSKSPSKVETDSYPNTPAKSIHAGISDSDNESEHNRSFQEEIRIPEGDELNSSIAEEQEYQIEEQVVEETS